jgi:hypothetical protein
MGVLPPWPGRRGAGRPGREVRCCCPMASWWRGWCLVIVPVAGLVRGLGGDGSKCGLAAPAGVHHDAGAGLGVRHGMDVDPQRDGGVRVT